MLVSNETDQNEKWGSCFLTECLYEANHGTHIQADAVSCACSHAVPFSDLLSFSRAVNFMNAFC